MYFSIGSNNNPKNTLEEMEKIGTPFEIFSRYGSIRIFNNSKTPKIIIKVKAVAMRLAPEDRRKNKVKNKNIVIIIN